MLGVKVIPQNNVGLVEDFGKYNKSIKAGLHFYIPIYQKITLVSLAQHPLKLTPYSVITKDNADVQVNITLNYHVTNPKRYEYDNSDSVASMINMVRGHLRDIIGKMDLNEALGSTTKINKYLGAAIGDLTNTYGINVDRIQIDEVTPSPKIQEAMNRQLTAEREKTASIAQAQGESESIRLTNEANNNAMVATATARATSTRATADAENYRIAKTQAALAKASDQYFKNQSINAYRDLANSPANMIIVPSDKDSSFGQVATLAKLLKPDSLAKK